MDSRWGAGEVGFTCAKAIAGEMIDKKASRTSVMRDFSLIGKRSEEHTSELQSLTNLVCRLLLEKKKDITSMIHAKYGPASRNYFAAKRSIGKLHEQRS